MSVFPNSLVSMSVFPNPLVWMSVFPNSLVWTSMCEYTEHSRSNDVGIGYDSPDIKPQELRSLKAYAMLGVVSIHQLGSFIL